jgi:hypothetical protein
MTATKKFTARKVPGAEHTHPRNPQVVCRGRFTARNSTGETFGSADLATLCLYTIQAFDRDHGFTVTDCDGGYVGEITRSGALVLI